MQQPIRFKYGIWKNFECNVIRGQALERIMLFIRVLTPKDIFKMDIYSATHQFFSRTRAQIFCRGTLCDQTNSLYNASQKFRRKAESKPLHMLCRTYQFIHVSEKRICPNIEFPTRLHQQLAKNYKQSVR